MLSRLLVLLCKMVWVFQFVQIRREIKPMIKKTDNKKEG